GHLVQPDAQFLDVGSAHEVVPADRPPVPGPAPSDPPAGELGRQLTEPVGVVPRGLPSVHRPRPLSPAFPLYSPDPGLRPGLHPGARAVAHPYSLRPPGR